MLKDLMRSYVGEQIFTSSILFNVTYGPFLLLIAGRRTRPLLRAEV